MQACDIERIISAAIPCEQILVDDHSDRHRDHPESVKSGGGHFTVQVVSAAFDGCSRLERHRKIHALLGPHFGQGLHALQMTLFTPDEWRQRHP